MNTKHGSVLLLACAMLAGFSATISTARAQGFGFFLPPPMYAPPPPPPFYGPDFYDEAEPYYYQRSPRRYRPAPQRKQYAPAPRRKKSPRAVERKAPLRKDRQVALTVPTKAPTKVATAAGCEKAQSSVAEFGFTAIKPQGCTGKIASFRAMRDGKSFDIQVLAASGELTKVQRLK